MKLSEAQRDVLEQMEKGQEIEYFSSGRYRHAYFHASLGTVKVTTFDVLRRKGLIQAGEVVRPSVTRYAISPRGQQVLAEQAR